MNTSTIRDLTSIIIPCWNQLEFTQQCIAALKSHTRPAWELIVVDNGSTDGTGTYLAGVRGMSTVPVTIVSNATNVGFPAAINQGLRLARGEYLVMLNNDVVVTDGWLDQLIALVNARSGAAEAAAGTLGNAEADGGGRPWHTRSHGPPWECRTSRSAAWRAHRIEPDARQRGHSSTSRSGRGKSMRV